MKRLARFARRLAGRLAFWRRRKRPARPPAGNRAIILAAIPVGLVAAIAGIVSYSHIVALGLRTHQGPADSHLLPFSVDGLIVAGTVILAAGSPLGWLGVGLGVAATLFANVQFGLPHGALSAAGSAWPAVAFTVACFMLERWLRRRGAQGDADGTAAAQSAQGVPRDKLDAAIHAMIATHQAGNGHSARGLAARFELPPKLAGKVRQAVLAEANGHAPQDTGGDSNE